MVREGSDCAARLPAVQPFPLASKDLPTAEEAQSGEPARDPDPGRNSSDQHIAMVRESGKRRLAGEHSAVLFTFSLRH